MKKYFLALILVILIFGVLYYIDRDNISTIEKSPDVDVDFFVSNKSWNTEFEKEVYYKKGDDIEFVYVIKNFSDKYKKFVFDVDDFAQKVGLDDVNVDNNDIVVSSQGAGVIKISGKSKNSGNIDQDIDIEKYISTKEVEQPKKEDAEKEPEEKEEKTTDISISLENTKYVSDVENLIRINGKGIDNIKSIGIGDKFFKIIEQDGYHIFLPGGSFLDGTYSLFYVLEDDSINNTNIQISFESKGKKTFLRHILPEKIENDIPRWISVVGKGFYGVVSIQLNNNNILENADFKVVSDTVLAVRIPAGLAAGDYTLNVMTKEGIFELDSQSFEVINVE